MFYKKWDEVVYYSEFDIASNIMYTNKDNVNYSERYIL